MATQLNSNTQHFLSKLHYLIQTKSPLGILNWKCPNQQKIGELYQEWGFLLDQLNFWHEQLQMTEHYCYQHHLWNLIKCSRTGWKNKSYLEGFHFLSILVVGWHSHFFKPKLIQLSKIKLINLYHHNVKFLEYLFKTFIKKSVNSRYKASWWMTKHIRNSSWSKSILTSFPYHFCF